MVERLIDWRHNSNKTIELFWLICLAVRQCRGYSSSIHNRSSNISITVLKAYRICYNIIQPITDWRKSMTAAQRQFIDWWWSELVAYSRSRQWFHVIIVCISRLRHYEIKQVSIAPAMKRQASHSIYCSIAEIN